VGAPGGQQLLNSLGSGLVAADLSETDQLSNAQAILRGPVARIPTGDIQAAIGSEIRHEKQDETFSLPAFGVSEAPAELQRTAYAAVTEARVPVLGTNDLARGGERLVLTLAARYDHSSDFGGKPTWQSGLLWRAGRALIFSGGYGTSYRAPKLADISGPQVV